MLDTIIITLYLMVNSYGFWIGVLLSLLLSTALSLSLFPTLVTMVFVGWFGFMIHERIKED